VIPIRPILRDLVGNVLYASGVTRPARAVRDQLNIVTFHRVLPEEELKTYPIPEIAASIDEFRWFVRFFRDHFVCAPLVECLSRWRASNIPPRPLLAITFDDGQRDNFLHARPILREVGLKASFFVPVAAIESNDTLWHDRLAYAAQRMLERDRTRVENSARALGIAWQDGSLTPLDFVECVKSLPSEARARYVADIESACGGPARPDWDGMMSWSELRVLSEEGHEIGSHSMSHALLPELDDRALRYEIGESRRIIEQNLGIGVLSFCYPNGDSDSRVVEMVKNAGYTQAVTTRWGPNPKDRSVFDLHRCDMQGAHVRSGRGVLSEARLAWRISGLHPGLN
jgi:peptidoglycan/xylan/chitin deacetylase (PgdA/CDA1 family)